MDDRATDLHRRATLHRRAGQGSARDRVLRQLVAEAAAKALEEAARRAPDPVAYLRAATAEITQLVDALGTVIPSEEARVRAIVAEEVEAAAGALIRRLQN